VARGRGDDLKLGGFSLLSRAAVPALPSRRHSGALSRTSNGQGRRADDAVQPYRGAGGERKGEV